MAANEFTPTGDSPREADDSLGIKGAIEAAMAEHDDAIKGDADGDDDKTIDDEVKTPDADKKPDGEIKAPPADDKTEIKADDKKIADDKKAADPTEPPSSWSADDKAMFKAQPKPAQEFLLKRHASMEADYTRKTQDIAGMRKEYEAIDQIFTPQRDRMKAAGVTANQLIQGWYNMEAVLQSGNFQSQAQLIANAAKNYKIDPVQLAHQILVIGGVADPKAAMEQIIADATDPSKAPPPPLQLPPEVTQRLDKVDRVAAHFESQQRAQAEAEVVRINTDLDKFKTAVDDKGAALHPYFDELVDTMAQLVERANIAKQPIPPIDQLYQDAIFANPVVRQKWLDAKSAADKSFGQTAQQTAAEKRAAEARAKSEKAKKAGSSVTGSPGSGQANGQSRNSGADLRSTIATAVDDQEQLVH